MRSPRAFAAGLVLLLGVPLALAFGDGAENVLHLVLAGCFALLALAVFDFKLPAWINLAGCAATGTLAAVFLLQGVSDIMQSAPLQHLAYDVLGQRLEKMLGYAFLLWCVVMFFGDSAGKTKLFGGVVLAMILGAEIYGFAIASTGGEASGALKLLYLPLFVWLVLEGMKRRAPPF